MLYLKIDNYVAYYLNKAYTQADNNIKNIQVIDF
jgi:hypothetical protein